MSLPPSSPSRMHTPSSSPRLPVRPHVSPLFRGIADEMDREHSVDPIVNGITATQWAEAQAWKNLVAQQIEIEIDAAANADNQEGELQLQREVAYLQQLDKDLFFHGLERLGFPITVEAIRDEIQKKLTIYLRDVVYATTSSPMWVETSPPSSIIMSSPLKKVIRPLPKKDRFQLALDKMTRENSQLKSTADVFGVSRRTLHNRIHNKTGSAMEHGKKCRLLDESDELALLQFIDRYCQLGFPPRFEMIKDKAMKLLKLRNPSVPPIGIHWVTRFLNRHPDYKCKFPRHLDQERHWNTDPKVFEDWFNLYKKTMEKYGIAGGDVYNMDEKGHLMGIAGNIR